MARDDREQAQSVEPIDIRYDDEKHKYWIDGVEVPSVSKILDETQSKPALPWWGMRVGMAAVVQMLGTTPWAEIANANSPKSIIAGIPDVVAGEVAIPAGKGARAKLRTLVEDLAVKNALTTNHVKEEAGDRGTAAHLVLEHLAVGEMPSIKEVPQEHRGWISAVANWWLDQEPEFVATEVIVGSREHQFAGRFDIIIRRKDGEGRLCRTDLKTSKSVYLSHLIQLGLYDVAHTEMGGETADCEEHMVLHARPDGTYTEVFMGGGAEGRQAARDVATAAARLWHATQALKRLNPGVG